ncbi:MAG TPA: transcriptional repressor, partial [Sediminispirochaeta sp.]|nr:transcriptional repressor [Sediminispirochaeta sp.]
ARMEGRFQHHGYRLTVPRQIILEILEENNDFLSAEDLFLLVHQRQPGIGLATVYRTLQLLVDLGFVTRIDGGDGRGRFKLATEDEAQKRGVLICNNCYQTISLDSMSDEQKQLLEQLEKNIEKAEGFKARSTILQIYGVCERCAEKSDSATE